MDERWVGVPLKECHSIVNRYVVPVFAQGNGAHYPFLHFAHSSCMNLGYRDTYVVRYK